MKTGASRRPFFRQGPPNRKAQCSRFRRRRTCPKPRSASNPASRIAAHPDSVGTGSDVKIPLRFRKRRYRTRGLAAAARRADRCYSPAGSCRS
jgi:hypothetical protein